MIEVNICYHIPFLELKSSFKNGFGSTYLFKRKQWSLIVKICYQNVGDRPGRELRYPSRVSNSGQKPIAKANIFSNQKAKAKRSECLVHKSEAKSRAHAMWICGAQHKSRVKSATALKSAYALFSQPCFIHKWLFIQRKECS